MEDYAKKGPVTSGELRLAGMDLLARREHGSSELTAKLTRRFRKRNCDPRTVESVVQQLIDEGLLSDERFAAVRARQLARRGFGPSRIRNDLRQRKPIEGDWDDRQRERARRLRFLQYRGFGSDISRRLVEADDSGAPPEDEPLEN